MKQIYRFLSLFFIISSVTALKAAEPVITSSLDSQTYWVNENFNYAITATESPDEYFAAGLEALGGTVTYNSASGLFEGAPGNAGEFEIAIAAENAIGRSTVEKFDVVVVPTAITSLTSANGVIGDFFSYEITTNSSEVVTFTDDGVLPPGLTREDNIISGTPTLTGGFLVTLSASDVNGSGDIEVLFNITGAVPVITSSLDEEILLGDSFDYTITATNSPDFFAGGSGAVPGLSPVNSTTGEFSGTPVSAGIYTIPLVARTPLPESVVSSPTTLNLVVHPELITSSSTASAVVDSPFVFEITTVNDEGLAYSNDDNLPPGLTRTDNIISGIPTLAGTYDVTISAASLDSFDDQVLTITVTNPAPEITSSLADQNVLAGVPYTGYTITGTYSPIGFSATGLDAVGGLVLDTATGVISGTPVNSGIFPITVAAENVASGFGNPSTFNIIVSPTVITSPSSTSGVVGTPLTYEITTAGTAPLAYGVQGSLPSGLSRSGTTISGTPDRAGTYTVTLSASNLDGTGSLSVIFIITDPTPAIDSSLEAQTILVNDSFNYTITATNNPTGFSVNGLDLIGGLVLNTSTGVISGTPLNEGDWVIKIGAENDAGTSPVEDLNLVVKSVQYFLEGEVGVPFSHTLTTTIPNGSIGVSGLGQIAGISRDFGTDDISGTPEDFGIYVLTVTATNEEGVTDTYDLTVTINKSGGAAPIPVITSSTSILRYEGEPIEYQIQTEGFPNSFEAFGLGSLGLALDSSTGEITGIPTSTGDFRFPIRVTNDAGTGSDILEIKVLPNISPEVVITSPSGGDAFTAGDYVEVLINATDRDGFIKEVTVFIDDILADSATPTGVDGQFRYNIATGIGDVGRRKLQVRAQDDRDNITESNILYFVVKQGAVPQVNIITPAPGYYATVGVPYEIRVSAVDPDGVIAAVGLNDILFGREPDTETTNNNTGEVTITRGDIIEETKSFGGQEDESVLTLMQPSSIPGEYVLNVTATFTDIVELVATAFDDAGNVVSSVPVQYSVNLGIIPDVSISSPLAGQSFTLGDNVPIEVIANDTDGIISQVEIFNSSISLGFAELTGLNTYKFDYLADAAGEVYLQARATDDSGNVSISSVEIINVVTGNIPVVAIDELNSVSNGDSITAGEYVTILVNAIDTDGFITQVQIFNNGVLLGQADPTGVAGQYRYTFLTDISNVGVLRLEARATDDRDYVGASSLVSLNVAPGNVPSVSIVSPSDGFNVNVGIPFEVRVSASDVAGRIASVRLRDINFQREEGTTNSDGVFTPGAVIEPTRSFNGNLMQESSVAGEYVYTATLTNPDIVDLVAVALDNSGNQVTSVPVQLYATTGSAPTVTITNPTNGGNSPYTFGDVIPIEISASDSDGNISSVEVYNGSTLLSEAFQTGESTFVYNYETNSSGLIELQARTTDNLGNVSVSGVETISVSMGESPTVNIVSPLNGSLVTSGNYIEILLNVADADGIISSVSVFKGGSLVGEALPTEVAGQYRYNLLTGINDVGSLDIWALANDEMGNRGYSNIVPITVVTGDAPTVTFTNLSNEDIFSLGYTYSIDITASDADGSVIQVQVFDGDTVIGDTSLGGSSSSPIDPSAPLSGGTDSVKQIEQIGESTFRFEYNANKVGNLNLRAQATDDSGNLAVSDIKVISVSVTPPEVTDFQASSDILTVSQTVKLSIRATDDRGISRVIFYANNERINITDQATSQFSSGPSDTYVFDWKPDTAGSFQLSAEVEDIDSIVTALSGPTITVTAYDPLNNDENFVNEVYLRLFNRSPSVAQLQEGLSVLDGSISSKCNYVASILASSTAENSELAMMVYRTMIGEWPNSQQLQEALEALYGSSSQPESVQGGLTLTTGQFEHSKTLSQGDAVTANVNPDRSSDNPIFDPILSVRAPDGTTIAYNDDFNGFNPQVDFTADTPGTYTFVVTEFFGGTGNFSLDIQTVSSGGITNPNALTVFLRPKYEERFSVLNASLGSLNQVFFNKHGQAPSPRTQVSLYDSLTGSDNNLSDSIVVPGYNSDTISFITEFARDNDSSSFVGTDGLPLSSVHLYEIPNDPISDLKVALAIAAFLEKDPTDLTLASYSGMSLEQALEDIILKAYSVTPYALDGATSLDNDWYWSSWFGMFAYTANSSNWIYSWRLGWVYVAPSGTPSGAWFYSSKLGAWLWSNTEMNGFYYHAGRNTWVYMLPEGADSPGAWLNYMDINQWQFVTP